MLAEWRWLKTLVNALITRVSSKICFENYRDDRIHVRFVTKELFGSFLRSARMSLINLVGEYPCLGIVQLEYSNVHVTLLAIILSAAYILKVLANVRSLECMSRFY